jgi:hypothetical protein
LRSFSGQYGKRWDQLATVAGDSQSGWAEIYESVEGFHTKLTIGQFMARIRGHDTVMDPKQEDETH